jgi:hypothetical protein
MRSTNGTEHHITTIPVTLNVPVAADFAREADGERGRGQSSGSGVGGVERATLQICFLSRSHCNKFSEAIEMAKNENELSCFYETVLGSSPLSIVYIRSYKGKTYFLKIVQKLSNVIFLI